MARIRVVGSAFTIWKVKNRPVLYCLEVSHRSPQPISAAVEVHPLNYIRPVEILTPRAITHGEIVMQVVETYGNRIWSLFGADQNGNDGYFSNPNLQDLADVLNTQLMTHTDGNGQSALKLSRIIKNPNGSWKSIDFEGVRVVDIREDETTRTETLQNNLQITCWYTRMGAAVDVSGSDVRDGHIEDSLQ